MKKTFQIMCCFTLLFPDIKRKRWKTSEEKNILFLTLLPLHTGLDWRIVVVVAVVEHAVEHAVALSLVPAIATRALQLAEPILEVHLLGLELCQQQLLFGVQPCTFLTKRDDAVFVVRLTRCRSE